MNEYDDVRLLTDIVGGDGVVIPAGTIGTVVDISPDGSGFAVDVKIGDRFDNVHAYPEQVELVEVKSEQ